MTDKADRRPNRVLQADAGYVPARSRLSSADFLLHLWRAKWLMLLVAVPVLVLGWLVASWMPVSYESRSALYVTTDAGRVDRDYGVPNSVQGELQILRTRLVAERTLSRFPLSRTYPEIAAAQERALQRSEGAGIEAIRTAHFQQGVDAFQKALSARIAPSSNVIELRLAHADPEVAAELLNAVMAAYLNRRAELFEGRPISEAGAERKKVEGDLLKAEDDIQAFIAENAIRDFASERATAQGLFSVISSELSTVEARRKAITAQLNRTRTQLAETPAEQDLFVEDSSAERLRELEIERNQALITYTPESRRVQAIDRQIEELKAFIEAQDSPAGTVRRGPNPIYQALETSLNSLEAEAVSLTQQSAELSRQLRAVEDKLIRFTGLEPHWNELLRNRDAVETRLRALMTDTQTDGSASDAWDRLGSVKVAEPATIANTGTSLKWPVIGLSLLFALFLAFTAGALKTRARRGFSTPGSLQRTTGMRVLATVGRA